MARITSVVIRKYDKKGNNLKAFANVTLDDQLVLTGIKVVMGNKGLFISMPSNYSESEDKYFDIFFPITADFREELQDAVIDAYKHGGDEPKKGKGKNKGKAKRRDEDEEEEDD